MHEALCATRVAVAPDTHITVTVSVGVAFLPADTTHPAELVLLADQLLYTAKEAGRDGVVADRLFTVAA